MFTGLRLAVQGQRQARAAGARVPQPGGRGEQHAVQRDQPQQLQQLHQVHRQDERTGDDRRAAQRRPQRPGPASVDDDPGAGLRARRPRRRRCACCRRSCGWPTRRSSTSAARSTALTPLVNVSKPVAPKLQKLLVQLRPLAEDSVPTVNDLSDVVYKPGPNNDLIDLTQLGVPLADATVNNTKAQRQGPPGRVPAVDHGAQRLDPGARDRPALRGRSDRLVRGLHRTPALRTRTAARAASRRSSASARFPTARSTSCRRSPTRRCARRSRSARTARAAAR